MEEYRRVWKFGVCKKCCMQNKQLQNKIKLWVNVNIKQLR